MTHTSKVYWHGKPLEDHTKEELIAIIKFQAQQNASAGETINQLTDLIGQRTRRW